MHFLTRLLIAYLIVGFGLAAIVFLHLTPGEIRPDVVNIFSITLVLAGTLYLAYDLLGGIRGPLRWITLLFTFALIGVLGSLHFPALFALIYATGGATADGSDAFKALLIAGSSGIIGIFSGMLIVLRQFAHRPLISRLWSIGIAGATGAVATLVFLLLSHHAYRLHAGQMIVEMTSGFMCAVLVQVWQLYTYRKAGKQLLLLEQKPERVFSWRDGQVGLVLAIFFAIAYLLFRNGHAIENFVLFMIFFCVSPVAATGLSRTIFWRVSHLSEHALALLGLGVIFIGSLLQYWEPIAHIMQAVGR